MLPKIEAFVSGQTLIDPDGDKIENPKFDSSAEYYRIAKPKERVPLEAEDWIKDGPWWIRENENDMEPIMVTNLEDGKINKFSNGSRGHYTKEESMGLQRRNATSDWMPCWKEKE